MISKNTLKFAIFIYYEKNVKDRVFTMTKYAEHLKNTLKYVIKQLKCRI